MTGNPRPDADEPGVLEQLGFLAPAQPVARANAGPAPYVAPPNQHHLPPQAARTPIEAPAASGTRRQAREHERRPDAASSGRSAERRIRQVQKSYAKPK